MSRKKRIIFSLKNDFLRELLVIKKLVEQGNFEVDVCIFLQRYYNELKIMISDHCIPIKNLYNFVSFSKNISKSCVNINIYEELCRIELELNVSIMDLIAADKGLIGLSFEDKINRIYKAYLFLNKIKVKNYDYSIQELSSSADILMYKILEKNKKKPIVFWHGRFNNRIEFTNITGERIGMRKLYEHYKNRDYYTDIEEKLYHKIVSEIAIPDYMTFATKYTPLKDIFSSIKWDLNKYKSYLIDKRYAIDSNKTIKDKFNKIYKLLYRWRLKNITDQLSDIKLKEYVVFPEQYTPEASTATYSIVYSNQLSVIETIRRNLPFRYSLVVKLHPSMDMNRSLDFINRINKMDHVYITRHNRIELLRNSSAIITLTSTMGWEGILLDKLTYVIGNVFYRDYDYITILKDFGELRKISVNINNWEKTIKSAEYKKNKKAFVLSSYLSLKKGNMNSNKDPQTTTEENITNLVNSILEYMSQCY
ncbi:MAG: hypothetical protein KA799_00865 [Bacteroidales bacterium]|nr:hypothetical protein [Bacteroidales bacterium]